MFWRSLSSVTCFGESNLLFPCGLEALGFDDGASHFAVLSVIRWVLDGGSAFSIINIIVIIGILCIYSANWSSIDSIIRIQPLYSSRLGALLLEMRIMAVVRCHKFPPFISCSLILEWILQIWFPRLRLGEGLREHLALDIALIKQRLGRLIRSRWLLWGSRIRDYGPLRVWSHLVHLGWIYWRQEWWLILLCWRLIDSRGCLYRLGLRRILDLICCLNWLHTLRYDLVRLSRHQSNLAQMIFQLLLLDLNCYLLNLNFI